MFLGIDPSLSSSGLVVIDDHGLPHASLQIETPASWPTQARFLVIWGRARAFMDSMDTPEVVTIEQPFYGNNKITSQMTSAVWGLMMTLVHLCWKDTRILEVHPSILKKFTCGKGNGDKEMVRKAIVRRFQFQDKCDDIVDAFGLAQIGRCAHMDDGFTPNERDVVRDWLRLKNVSESIEG